MKLTTTPETTLQKIERLQRSAKFYRRGASGWRSEPAANAGSKAENMAWADELDKRATKFEDDVKRLTASHVRRFKKQLGKAG